LVLDNRPPHLQPRQRSSYHRTDIEPDTLEDTSSMRMGKPSISADSG
jgi:hypothetical protein